MNPRTFLTSSLLLLATLALAASTFAQNAASTRLSSRFLARGELALLEVITTGREAEEPPVMPNIPSVSIQPEGFAPRVQGFPGRPLEYAFQFAVSSYEVGRHIIPSIEVTIAGGVRVRTEPVEFVVFNPDELVWSEAQVSGMIFQYSAFIRTFKPSLFENETVYSEIKLYVPRDISMSVVDWGIPDFERDGMTSWRFEPGEARGRANLNGGTFTCLGYPSTMAPTRTGTVGIGPAKVRLTHRATSFADGFPRAINNEVFLPIPKLQLESKPLPPGAPEGFKNAVGKFTVAASAADDEIREGDPVSIDLVVSGSGNLDTLQPPQLVDTDGWKIYDATPNQRGEERRFLHGTTTFQQFMRPLELKSVIPSFRLVYFDPDAETYHTLTTEPIALKMLPSTAPPVGAASPPQALSLPVERMTDILGNLRPANLLASSVPLIPPYFIHLLGGLLAFLLTAKALWMRIAPRLRKDPVREARLQGWRDLSKINAADDTAFLRASGAFVERWYGNTTDPALLEVIAERDALCFRQDTSNKLLPSRRRAEILSLLRKASLTCIAILLGLASFQPLHAQEPATPPAKDIVSEAMAAFDSGDYESSIKSWLAAGTYESLSSDTLYNIGNACYRLGSPGHAALYYRRALAKDTAHSEARQNLRFIERKHGAITIRRPAYQYAIARIPLTAWQNLVWASAWLALIAFLVFPASHRGDRIRIAAVCALIAAPLIAATGALGWRYFPDDSQFAPLARQAVILGEKVVLHSEASRTSPEVIDAPPGSLCEVLRHTGRWVYVSFATQTRGWVPVESIEPIIPNAPLQPPVIRKPKADGRSA
jgi:tetratricopeptide (TPR) repeat protein